MSCTLLLMTLSILKGLMKYLISYTLIILLSPLFTQGQKADFRSDYVKMNLKGNVESIREVSYLANLEGKIIENRVDSSKDNCSYLFQNDGRLQSVISYQKNGKVWFIQTFKYDNHGRLLEQNKLNPSNILTSKTVTEFDNLDLKLKETKTDGKGQFVSEIICKYIMKDSNNYSYSRINYTYGDNEIITVSFSNKNLLTYKISEYLDAPKQLKKFKYYYNLQNQLIRVTVEDIKGKVFTSQEYEYDNRGNVINMIEKVPDHVVRYTYQYNSIGDWVKRFTEDKLTGANNGKLREINLLTLREIKYF